MNIHDKEIKASELPLKMAKFIGHKLLDKPIACYKEWQAINALKQWKNTNNNVNSKIRVGFIVQVPESWNKQVDVYEEMCRRDNFEVILFAVPPSDFYSHTVMDTYDRNYFLETYENVVKAIDETGKVINLSEFNLDYVFYQRPYDVHLPKELRSSCVMKYSKCCYIPYGVAGADVFNGGNICNDFFNRMYICFMDSDYMVGLLNTHWRKYKGRRFQHFKYLGFPVLEHYLKMEKRDEIQTITWAPRWSYDEKLGGSNFLEYKEGFLELCKNLPKNIKVIFRPHPLMFEELVYKGLLKEEEKKYYIEQLNLLSVKIDTVRPINEVLEETDILISDFSSILGEFILTNRPIIYCDKGIVLNKVYDEFAEHMYIARNWDEVERNISMLFRGEDVLQDDRKRFIEQKSKEIKGSAKKMVDYIKNDYLGKR